MSGKRQHYIPQFLQTGFLSRVDGKTNFTVVYRKGMQPKEISTRHVGVETHFYNKANDTLLDDLITEAESTHYAQLILNLRKSDEIEPDSVEALAKLISHFQFRSRNLRLSIIEATRPVIDMIIEEFNEPDLQIEFIKYLALTQPDVDPLVIQLLNDPAMVELLTPKIIEFFNDRRFFENMMKLQTVNTHQIEMKKSIEPESLVKSLKKFSYQTLEVEDFPLGDSMVIFRVKNNGEERWKTIVSKTDKLIYVVLPISSNKLLIGINANMLVDYDEIRDGIIECSYEFFIAHSVNSKLEKSVCNIGKNSNLTTSQELKDEMKKVRRSFGIS